ncbi:MAG: phytanoyl-CoA dioxygenase family protein [Pirellulaceae bacterium]|nr:phytanoyl-CoA dioxygenase family protein [Planctomycetales bacterium]
MASSRTDRIWWSARHCRLDDLVAVLNTHPLDAGYAHADRTEQHIPIYAGPTIRDVVRDPAQRREMQAEWADVMLEGPGIVVIEQAFDDLESVDAASAFFRQTIDQQHRDSGHAGDHFAKPGANDRIWNALEKLCLSDPHTFARYYGNPIVAWIAQAWLGNAYQMTSQVNVVNPGGEPQSAHRDYHMGFQTAEEVAQFPAHVHRLCPLLTLQGAVAHVDMPLASGPTLYLPFSQRYEQGYLAWRQPEFQDYFRQYAVQLPMRRGDAVFFNPAVFHAAGGNRTDNVYRMANLLQVSSAYGRAMESVDRTRMCLALYPALCELRDARQLSAERIASAIAASAEGYSFPTNLDRDPPIGGLAPQSQQQLLSQAMDERWDVDTFREHLLSHAERRIA